VTVPVEEARDATLAVNWETALRHASAPPRGERADDQAKE
jgi:hypothetical protein